MSKPKKTENSKSATTGKISDQICSNTQPCLTIFALYFIIWNFRILARTTTYQTGTAEDETLNDYTLTGGDVTQERMSNHAPSTKGVCVSIFTYIFCVVFDCVSNTHMIIYVKN